jgi:DNA-binding NtrC family response regulator
MAGERTVLVVDDEADVRVMIRAYLQPRGYEVLEAPDASRALAEMASRPDIRLVITDVVMPGSMNGFELGKSLKQTFPSLKVLFMSGYSAAAMISEAMTKPENIVRKPFRLKAMLERVEDLLAEA